MFHRYLLVKQSRLVVACTLVGLLALNSATVANPEPVTEEVEIIVQVTNTENNALQIRLLDQNFANTEIISTGTKSVATDASRIVGGTQAAANFTALATPAQAITILVDAIVVGTGYELAGVRCEYSAGADTTCNGASIAATSAASANLLVDATMTGDDLAATEVVNIRFDVTVAYQ